MQETQDGRVEGPRTAPDPQACGLLLRPEILNGEVVHVRAVEVGVDSNSLGLEMKAHIWRAPSLVLTPTAQLCYLQGESAFSLVVRGSGGVLLRFTPSPVWSVPFQLHDVVLASIESITTTADLKLLDLVPVLLPFLP